MASRLPYGIYIFASDPRIKFFRRGEPNMALVVPNALFLPLILVMQMWQIWFSLFRLLTGTNNGKNPNKIGMNQTGKYRF